MIDQSNRAGKSPIVSVFKSHRLKPSSSHAPGGHSDGEYRTDPSTWNGFSLLSKLASEITNINRYN